MWRGDELFRLFGSSRTNKLNSLILTETLRLVWPFDTFIGRSDEGTRMSEDADIARERVIESLEQSAEVYGLSRSSGRIYGVLYFADGPLSIPELVERTGYE